MKTHKQYSPEGAESVAAVSTPAAEPAAPAEVNGFDELLKQNQPETWAAQQAAKGNNGAEKKEAAEGGEKKEEKAEGKENKEPENKEEKKEEPTFKLPAKEKISDITSFVEMGKQLGLETKEDTYEALKSAFDAKLKSVEDAVVAKQKEEAFRIEQRKHSPQAQELLELLNNGGSVDDYINPVKPFQELKALGDEELVRKNLTLQGMSEEDIDAEIAHLVSRDRVKTTADTLRNGLDAHIQKTQKGIIEKQKQLYTKAVAKENSEIKEALSKTNDLHGILIPADVKNNLVSEQKINEYRERFRKDPATMARAIYLLELGDQAVEITKTRAYEEGMTKNVQKLHNLDDAPIKTKTGATVPHKEEGLTMSQRFQLELDKSKAAA